MGTFIDKEFKISWSTPAGVFEGWEGQAKSGVEATYQGLVTSDIEDFTITISGLAGVGASSGIVFRFEDFKNVIPDITSAEIISIADGFSGSLSFDANSVNFNWASTSFNAGLIYKIQLGFSPTDIDLVVSPDASTVMENATGIVIGKLSNNDFDSTTSAYTVDNDAFEVVEGVLKLKDDRSLDFESTENGQISLKVTSQDGSGAKGVWTETFTIKVGDQNEKPELVGFDNSYTVRENTPAALIDEQVSYIDPEGDGVTYSFFLADGKDEKPTDLFEIVGGQLKLAAGKSLDFETMDSLQVKVVATENGEAGLHDETYFTVNVTDVDETPPAPVNTAPFLIVGQANPDVTVQAGTTFTATVGDGHFSDLETLPANLTYTMTVSLNGQVIANPTWLTLNADGGLLSANPTTADAGIYSVSVFASDGSATSAADEFLLTVAAPTAQNIRGTRGDDRNLVGGDGDDTINGKRGNDRMTGGDGADTFVFSAGHDKVLDFDGTQGDMIDLGKAKGITDFEDLMAHHVKDTDAGLKITATDGSWMFLKGVDADDLTADMFVF